MQPRQSNYAKSKDAGCNPDKAIKRQLSMFDNEEEIVNEEVALDELDSENSKDDSTKVIEESKEEKEEKEELSSIENLRNEYKSLKKDLETYKSSHKFITDNFGDTETASQAKQLFDSFSGSDFDENTFLSYIKELSPQRTDKLVETLATERAKNIADAKVKELFGGSYSPEELKLFKEFKESGYGLAASDDVPDEFRFNEDGSPKSEKEIEFLRNLYGRVKSIESERETERQELQRIREQEKASAIQREVDNFANSRLAILEKEYDNLGLNYIEGDSAETKSKKEAIKAFITHGVIGSFLADPTANSNYEAALNHIRNKEPLLAKRYEARIESQLLDIVRSDHILNFLKTVTTHNENPESRPEISTSGNYGVKDTTTTTGRVTANDIAETLIRSGKVRP